MRTITRFDQPASLEAPEMFVLHAERAVRSAVLEEKIGDSDMAERPELTFPYSLQRVGEHPHSRHQQRAGLRAVRGQRFLGVAPPWR